MLRYFSSAGYTVKKHHHRWIRTLCLRTCCWH